MNENEYGQTWRQAWDLYRANHPEVIASWGEQNGRKMRCTCKQCDPDQLRQSESEIEYYSTPQ